MRSRIFTVSLLIVIVAVVSAAPQESSLNRPRNHAIHFVVIGDRTGGHQPGIYEAVVADVERLHPDFVVTVGDQIEGYTEDTITLIGQWNEYFSLIKPLTMPIHLTPGNHDITTDAALPMYRRFVGEPYGSFDEDSLHFIWLDNSRWDSSDKLPKEQFDWLAKDLSQHANAILTFVLFHKPFWYATVAEGKPDTLHTLFVKYGVDAVFSGHFHQYFSGTYDGILYTCVGSSGAEIEADPGDMSYHFAWVTVEGKSIDITPIKHGAVLPWNAVTVSEEKTIDQVWQRSVAFQSSAPVSADLTVPPATISLRLHNWSPTAEAVDTVRWKVPDGWSVEPASLPMLLPANGEATYSFKVKSTGRLYPAPSMSVNLPYKAGRQVTVSRNLPVQRTVLCVRADKPPVIDGRVTESIWRNPATSFFSADGTTSPVESTSCYFAYDSRNLYLAARCRESVLDSIRAKATEHDAGIFGEDCVGYFFHPDSLKDTVFQIYFNPLGTVFDQKISRGPSGYYGGDKTWNSTCKVETAQEAGFWSVEIQLPLSQFQVKAKKGAIWRINFLRKQQHLYGAADWQAPIDYDPTTFGVMVME